MYPAFYDLNAPSRSSINMMPESYQRVQYTDSSQEPKGAPMCGLLIGFIVIVLLIWFFARSGCGGQRVVPVFVNGMRSKVDGKEGGDDVHIKMDKTITSKMKKPGSTGKGLHNLTPCDASDPSKCQDVKKIDPLVHTQNEKHVREFLGKHKVSMIMVYAPWCPHCHTAMPEFAKAASQCDVPFALINAELMPPKLLQGDSALFNVQYFPFIMRRESNGSDFSDTLFKDQPTADKLKQHADKNALQYMFG